jgi:hypothetical protein
MTIETDRVTTLLFEVTLSPRDTVCPRGDAFLWKRNDALWQMGLE